MSSAISELTQQAMRGIVAKKDAIVIAELKNRVEFSDVIDIAHRCSIATYPDGVETLRFDGVEIIAFFPPTFETVADGDGYKLEITRRYKLLNQETKGRGHAKSA